MKVGKPPITPSVSGDVSNPSTGQSWFDTTTGLSKLKLPIGIVHIPVCIYKNATVSNTVANTSSETAFNLTKTISAGVLVALNRLEIKISGRISSKAALPGTVTFTIKWGTTILTSTEALTLVSSMDDRGFEIFGKIFFETVGSSCTTRINSVSMISASLGVVLSDIDTSSGTITLNTTVDGTITPFVTFSVSDAANKATIEQMEIFLF